MPNHPFCIKLQLAADHTKHAHELAAELMTRPAYLRLEHKDAQLLETARNTLNRMSTILQHICSHALDAFYIQDELPSLEPTDGGHDLEAVKSPSPHNACPLHPV